MKGRSDRRPNRRLSKVWLSLAATAAGLALLTLLGIELDRLRETDTRDATAAVTARFRQQIPADAPPLAFRDRAVELGVGFLHGPGPRGRTLPEDTGSGLAWGDYDGDGDFDLYLVSFPGPLGGPVDPAGGNRLYRNDGSRWVDVTNPAGVEDLAGFGMGASFADFDGDGDADLYVTNHGPNRLFVNRGDGSFQEVAAAAGVDDPQWSIAAAWGDFDRDGRLDLYVTNYVDFEPEAGAAFAGADPDWQGVPVTLNPNAFDPQPNRLYRQTGGGRFQEIGLEVGASNDGGRSLAATAVDLDGDGWLDLYVANDVSPNALLRNRAGELGGALLFEDWSAMTGTADPRGSMGISVADLPGADGTADGLPDLFITHWVAQENALYQAVPAGPGGLEYRDKVRHLRMGEVSTDKVGWGAAFVDLDRDGRVDLAVANGSTLEEKEDPSRLIAQPLFLFWNDGERFVDLAPAAGEEAARPRVARGLAAADFDLDGDSDLAVSVNRGRPLVLANESAVTGRWLAVRLAGAAAADFGARLELTAAGGTVPEGNGGGPAAARQVRWWGADASYASQHAPEILFGLGEAPGPADLRVRRADGRELLVRGLPPDHRVVLVGTARDVPGI